MSAPLRTAAESQAQATFTALMWALSYPGSPQALPRTKATGILAIAEALVDLETSYYTPDPQLDQQIAQMGARRRDPDRAMYQFFPQLCSADLGVLWVAPIGTFRDPDQSATLVIGCQLGDGSRFRLRGPGIQGSTELRVGGLPDGFWALRAASNRYPLGWDVLLVDGERVIGLPRTTLVYPAP
ncbi:MAG: phosphonate C-P lyase system protein PhnH [Roseiflexaceae bacterium]|nr:phosphonate C-P lyase system protein PhnH [Roseiflexaceae bacterium]